MSSNRIQTTGIDHLVLQVSDVARSKCFYVDVLGMGVVRESPRHVFLNCGSQLIGLFQTRDKAGFRTGCDLNHLAFQVDSGTYEEIVGTLGEQGLEVTGRKRDPRCIYFNDPDGHRLQIVAAERR